MQTWALRIQKIDNGYLLVGNDMVTAVVEEFEGDKASEVQCSAELLWKVMDYFSLGGSKHDEERVRVVVE